MKQIKNEDFSDVKVIQKHLKELMKMFHRICDENGLIYNLYGGTFLGAVRHGDIIPWDDDIDVSMPRADYEKFITIVKEKYSDKFDISAYPQKNYIYAFAKFGNKNIVLTEYYNRKKYSKFYLYIDIFPIDGYPELDDERIKERFDRLRKIKTKKWKSIARIIPSNVWWKKLYVPIKFFKYLPYRIIGYEKYLSQEVEESIRYKFEDSKYVSCAASWQEKGKTLKADYLDRVLYDFGDEKYYGLRNYDKYLSNLYQDYMCLPPVEKRTPTHYYKLEFRR